MVEGKVARRTQNLGETLFCVPRRQKQNPICLVVGREDLPTDAVNWVGRNRGERGRRDPVSLVPS